MGIASSTQPSLRTRVLARFPVNVLAGSGILITKSGVNYTFAVNPAILQDLPLSNLVDIGTDSLLGRGSPGVGPVETLGIGSGLILDGSNNLRLADIPTDVLLGRDTTGTGAIENITVAAGLQFTGGKVLQPTVNSRIRQVVFPITGAPISAGTKYDWFAPCDCVITGITLLGDQAGNITLDLQKSPYASFSSTVPGSANTICAAAKPQITGGIKYQDLTLTGWTTSVAVGDVIRFVVSSPATFTRVVVNLTLRVDT